MKLYEFGPTRSLRVRWTLQELGVDFESVIVNLVKGEHRMYARPQAPMRIAAAFAAIEAA